MTEVLIGLGIPFEPFHFETVNILIMTFFSKFYVLFILVIAGVDSPQVMLLLLFGKVLSDSIITVHNIHRRIYFANIKVKQLLSPMRKEFLEYKKYILTLNKLQSVYKP